MERQRQRTLLEWIRDKVESFFAAVSTFVARTLLGKNLFEEEYRKRSMQEEAKKMFDNTEKDKGEEACRYLLLVQVREIRSLLP